MTFNKKKMFLLLIVVTTPIISCYAGPFILTTKYDQEIDLKIRNELHNIGSEINNGIANEDFNSIRKYFSSELLNSNKFDLTEFTQQMSRYFKINSISLMYEYHSTLTRMGAVNNATILSEDKNRLIINQAYFDTTESYALFYKIDGYSSQLLSYIYLNKYNDVWKITNMHIGSYSVGNLNAPDLYELMKESIKSDKIGSALFYGVAMQKVLRPVNNLQYRDETNYKDKLKKLIEDFQTKNPFPIDISTNMVIYQMDIKSIKNEPILPTIKYVTDLELTESAVQKLLDENLNKIYKLLPGIKEDFSSILFQAFSEPPVDPNKEYELYGTIIETHS